ncbi:MAG: acetyl-CoA carboxylase biotin carboxyl carrier protein [Candidatus Aminicenantes bacterium]|jgi:acetyl-CoA carboxylase biotin carboxyl carrier protein
MKNKIDYTEIKKLIDLMEERNLSHFELEVEGFKIQFSKNQQPRLPAVAVQAVSAAEENGSSNKPETQTPDQPVEENNLHFIRSPMVGTFYRAPNPSSPAFVEVGENVKKDQTLCIIEAMKLMNEIDSDIDGVIEEIFVENGKPIEYGQRLFSIKPD